jgi:fluoroacetyl-CoA thioesterase
MSTLTEPKINTTDTATLKVATADLASYLPELCGGLPTESFPSVLATSRLVALMELAAARILVPFLPDGHLSVGVSIDITHSAPTPLDARVEAEAKYLGKKGKLFEFEIIARDEKGEIGKARHVRAMVDVKRLETAAEGRREKKEESL